MEYEIQPGDYIIALARKHNTTEEVIKSLNPKILDFNKINSGDKINLPDASMPTTTKEVGASGSGNEEVLIDKAIEIIKPEAAPVVAETPVANQAQPTVVSPTAEKTFSEAASEVNEIIGDKVQGVISYIQDKLSLDNITDLLKDKPYLYGFMQSKGLLLDKPNVEAIQKTLTETKAAIEETAKPILANPDSLLSQAVGLSKKVVTKIEPKSDLATLEPAIEKNAQVVPVVSETGTSESNATQEKLDKLPPDDSELTILIDSLEPLSTAGKKVYEGAQTILKGIKFDNTEDAKALYKQLSEDAERETKKIDDSIAAIAEEKIKPTFTDFNKFMAVLGAAMGAYGSAMTATPNYALQIINNAIDADQKQFLASQEIRTKSLLDQRQSVLQRRSDLLQLGLNQADRMLKIAQLQQDNQLKIANVQGVIDGINNAAIETKNEQTLVLIEILSKKAAATKLAETAQTKDLRERAVKSIEVTNGDGETVVIPGYSAPTPKAAAEQTLIREQSIKINTLLTSMHDLYTNENNWLPGVINESAVKLEQDQKELLLLVKNINKMGANFTLPEIEMITATIPTTDLSGKLSTGLIKIKKLRNKYISDQKATMESFGYTKMPNAASKQKRGPGMKIGVSK